MTQQPREAWLEIAVEVAGIDAELAADVLRQACSGGVVIEPSHRLDAAIDAYVVDGDGPAVVRGYLLATPESARVRKSLRLALQIAPLSAAGGSPRWRRVRRLREQSWRDSWKKFFGIQRIGRALVVKPSWVRYAPKPGETLIEIDPGMAFGTGQHPTTAMCLRALEELVWPGARVLDLGCGSGILGIAAAKLGAIRVTALDIDPMAVAATRENAPVNGVADVIEARDGTLNTQADGAFDLAVSNISRLALERLAPALARALAPGGVLVTSGFLEDAVEGLARAYEASELAVERVVQDGDWRMIISRAPV